MIPTGRRRSQALDYIRQDIALSERLALLQPEPDRRPGKPVQAGLGPGLNRGHPCHPSDWLVNDCPEIWTDDGGTRRYSWYQSAGLEFADKPERYDGYLSAV